MSLRNQPYFPLYVQDYLTDEKLNMCSWKTQGIYIKVLCILHKQTDYGSIVLFKQTSKQILDFALILIKQIPCSIEDMQEALEELIFYNILTIDDNKLLQKRMVKDGEVSLKRSEAGKTGGGNPNLFKQTPKQKVKQTPKQNTEDEIEVVVDNDYVIEIVNYLNSVCGTFYKHTTKNTIQLIKARIKEGFTVNDFKIVIDKKFNEWNNTEMSKFLRPDTLFSNKFEGYLNQVINKKQTKGDETIERAKQFTERIRNTNNSNDPFMLTV